MKITPIKPILNINYKKPKFKGKKNENNTKDNISSPVSITKLDIRV